MPWREWVIQWKKKADPSIYAQVQVLRHSTNLDDAEIHLVALQKGVPVEEWVRKWSRHPAVASLHPNYQTKLGNGIVDTRLGKIDPFYHLDTIRAKQAWKVFQTWEKKHSASEVVVAVVDTGVDLNHPVLAPFLLPGINVRNRSLPPQDEMGHGTEVAGVIAGVWGAYRQGNAPVGKGKILPIKVMENGEDGEVFYTVEGIREAIRQKADIIVLAQGSWSYSKLMADAIREAEENGVLVVGAVGNATFDLDGQLIYNRPLYYPAAFPTVLSVGSIRHEGSHEPTSNVGDGIDLVAPGESISTASLDGKMSFDSGTSFAAPQVAGVAALIWQMHPDYSPREIRNLLCQTAAKATHEPLWDEKKGYGILDALEAVRATWKPDWGEPNGNPAQAMPLSFHQEMDGRIANGDEDWFVILSPHTGTFQMKNTVIRGKQEDLVWTAWIPSTGKRVSLMPSPDGDYFLPVPAERVYIGVRAKRSGSQPIDYRFVVDYRLAQDAYETNDRFADAKVLRLTEGIHQYRGTIHRSKDEDWYRLQVPVAGEVEVTVQPRSPRFDPVIVQLAGENGRMFREDQGGEGEAESFGIRVEPGITPIVFRVSDYGGNPGDEPYQLEIHFTPKRAEGREPNDRVKEATPWHPGETISESIADEWDVDWYTFHWEGGTEWVWSLEAQNAHKRMEWVLCDEKRRVVDSWSGSLGEKERIEWKMPLKKGRYYLRFQGNPDGKTSGYRIQFLKKP